MTMNKTLLTVFALVFSLTAVEGFAQDNATTTTKTERTAENIKKEADAIKNRIEQYTIKIEANKDNEKVDYEAELVRLAEMKAKWEELTGETWKEEKKAEKK